MPSLVCPANSPQTPLIRVIASGKRKNVHVKKCACKKHSIQKSSATGIDTGHHTRRTKFKLGYYRS